MFIGGVVVSIHICIAQYRNNIKLKQISLVISPLKIVHGSCHIYRHALGCKWYNIRGRSRTLTRVLFCVTRRTQTPLATGKCNPIWNICHRDYWRWRILTWMNFMNIYEGRWCAGLNPHKLGLLDIWDYRHLSCMNFVIQWLPDLFCKMCPIFEYWNNRECVRWYGLRGRSTYWHGTQDIHVETL
jgi:hypothetical protein